MDVSEEHGDSEGPGEAFRLLFVCTGNTCRSPMAQAIAQEEIRRRGWTQVEVASAGVAAAVALPASPQAVRVAGEVGLDLTSHRSSPLSSEALERADLILTMGPGHLAELERAGMEGRAALITAFAEGREEAGSADGGVPDPVGGGEEEYRTALQELRRLVNQVLDRLEPMLAP